MPPNLHANVGWPTQACGCNGPVLYYPGMLDSSINGRPTMPEMFKALSQ